MSAPNEDQIQLGRQRAKEFFGEKHSSELAGQAVQVGLRGFPEFANPICYHEQLTDLLC